MSHNPNIFYPLDGQVLALEKNHPETPALLTELLKICRVEKSLDAIYQFRLSPYAVWSTLHRGASIDAVIQTLNGASSYPLPDLFLQSLRREVTRGERLLQGLPPVSENAVDAEALLKVFEEQHALLKLRPSQVEALRIALSGKSGPGIFVLPGGSGKTLLGILMSVISGMPTLFILPNPLLKSQWQAEIRKHGLKLPAGSSLFTADELGKEVSKIPAGIELVVADEVHSLHSPDLRRIAALGIPNRAGLTASPDFSDELSEEFFLAFGPILFTSENRSLVPPLTYTEIKLELGAEERRSYLLAKNALARFRIACQSEEKFGVVEKLLERHAADKTVVLSEYLEPLEYLAKTRKLPFLTGKSHLAARKKAYAEFNSGKASVLLSSAVSDEGVDLPSADVLIQISGKKDDSVQELQRLGRLLRPKAKPIRFYTLVSRNTTEEVSARNRRIFLESSGLPCVFTEESFAKERSEPETN